MVRTFIFLLALAELALGTLGLVAAVLFASSHPAGLSVLPLPLLALAVLLLAASAALFVRRPWSYYAHGALLIVIAPLFAHYVAPLLGIETALAWLLAVAAAAALIAAFLPAAVRRYFGL